MAATLTGKRILVIEDEYFIASDLSRALNGAGAEVAGPSGDLGTGLALIDGTPIDAAILDVNLEGAFSYEIADVLARRSVPFLFVTGYDDWALPKAYQSAPRVAKPFQMATVVDRLAAMIAEAA